MPALPEQFGRYRILKKLGQGGMGAVYLAEDTVMRRKVALKIPQFDGKESKAILERFYREARVAAEIHHSGICPVYDVGCIGDVHYLTMGFIEGTPLDGVLRSGEVWPVDRALDVVLHIAEALQVLHARGIVHRDLKPANIILRPDGTPVLLDFGLARSVVVASQQLTADGAALGTPAYMSPEQIEGKADRIAPATDVYALGVILFQLLTGRLPFQPASITELLGQVLFSERPRVAEFRPGVAVELNALCLAALAIDPAHRPADMTQMIARLKQCREGKEGVVTQCPRCDKKVRITEKMASKKVLCPGCRAPLPKPNFAAPDKTALMDRNPSPQGTLSATNLVGEPARLSGRKQGRLVFAGAAVALTVLVAATAGWLVFGKSAEPTSPVAQATQPTQATRPAKVRPKTLTNSIGMQFVTIPAGTFQMGPSAEELAVADAQYKEQGVKAEEYKLWLEWELPRHEVEITRPYYLGVYEVTQQEYERVMKKNPSSFCATGSGMASVVGVDTRRFPVDSVSWHEAVRFCAQLSSLPDEKNAGRRYRLPTEAEWEYACRGGSPVIRTFHFGDTLTHAEANFDTAHPFHSTEKKPPINRPVAVDDPKYRPNVFGLYHMHGNIWEWCSDRFDENYYRNCAEKAPCRDPQGPATTELDRRLIRGGPWDGHGTICRSAARAFRLPDEIYQNFGFRVVCVVED